MFTEYDYYYYVLEEESVRMGLWAYFDEDVGKCIGKPT